MRRLAMFVAALMTTLTWTSSDLDACGDKFVRVGQSARLRGYAAIHRASILVYQPARPDAQGARELEEMLTRAGHKPVFIAHGTDVARAAASAHYDLVIANYADAAPIKEQLRSLPARPDVVPMIVKKPPKAVEVQVEREYHSILAPYRMNKSDALEAIDHAMATRLKGMTSPGTVKK